MQHMMISMSEHHSLQRSWPRSACRSSCTTWSRIPTRPSRARGCLPAHRSWLPAPLLLPRGLLQSSCLHTRHSQCPSSRLRPACPSCRPSPLCTAFRSCLCRGPCPPGLSWTQGTSMHTSSSSSSSATTDGPWDPLLLRQHSVRLQGLGRSSRQRSCQGRSEVAAATCLLTAWMRRTSRASWVQCCLSPWETCCCTSCRRTSSGLM